MKRLAIALVAMLGARASATPFDDSPTLRAMKDELARSVSSLELPGSSKPYYLSYALWELKRIDITASFGAIVESTVRPMRTVDIDLRVGDYTFDNSNAMGDVFGRSITLPTEDDYDAVRRELWLVTDRRYKRAAEMLERKRAVAHAETKRADDADAFSKEPPSHIVDERVLASPDPAAASALVKKLSAVFRKNPDVHDSSVTISAMHGRVAFVSSEGSASLQPVGYVRIAIECHGQADDGMPLHDGATWWAQTFDQLPGEAELLAQAERLSNELSALRKAPIVDDYAGPVLFTNVAAGELLRALVAEQFSGTPPAKADRPGAKWASESELVSKLGQRILPLGVSVVDDPTIGKLGKSLLVGGTRFDEEGMPAQKVSLVENGTFKRFVMSRIPRKGFEHTNGHAASSTFSPPRAHPANLILSATGGVADAELRRRALALAKEQGARYVVVVDRLEEKRPFDEMDPAMFRGESPVPRPLTARRIYADGREELVRGASFGAITLRNLRDIAAVGATPTAYSYFDNGMPMQYGAYYADRGGGFLVSIASPALLFRDLDVKKPQGPERQPPATPRPR